MGAVFRNECVSSDVEAAGRLCSSEYPRTETQADGSIRTLSCEVVSGSEVRIVKAAAPGACTGTTWTVTTLETGSTTFQREYGAPAQACAGLASLSPGETVVACSVSGSDGAGWSITWEKNDGSTTYHGSGTLNGCPASGGTPAVTTSLPVSFPTCDASETYTDMSAVWALGLIACASVWAVKTFLYKLVTNQ